jgi:monothiol bacilliredoxin
MKLNTFASLIKFMKLFNNLFKSDSNSDGNLIKSNIKWIKLETTAQLDGVKTASNSATTVIFKHSTRCGVSRMVLKSFEEKWVDRPDINYYFLDLIRHRDVSNAVSEVFGVVHQSPQLIVLKESKTIASDSHYGILELNI